MIAAAKTARFYDALAAAAGRDVDREVAAVARIVRERGAPAPPAGSGSALLVARCGTGATLEGFAREFAADGFDPDPLMVQLARSRAERAEVWQATLETFDVPHPYAAIVALSSALAYARTRERLEQVARRLAAALAPGGVLIAEPYVAPDRYEVGRIESVVVDEPRFKVARMALTTRVAAISIIDYHSLVASNMGVERHFARHERGLFALDEYRSALEAAGLHVEFLDEPAFTRGVFCASRERNERPVEREFDSP